MFDDITVLDWSREFVLNALGCLNDVAIHFVIQAALLALLPTLFCALAYVRNVRLVPLQAALAIAGVITAITIPLDRLQVDNVTARLWLLTICAFAVLFLPPLLGFLVAPNPVDSRKITTGAYVTIVGLTIWQVIVEVLKQ